jgi:hypothetical protein
MGEVKIIGIVKNSQTWLVMVLKWPHRQESHQNPW